MPVRSNKYVNIRSSDKSNLGKSSGGIVGDYVVSVNGMSGKVVVTPESLDMVAPFKAYDDLVIPYEKVCIVGAYGGDSGLNTIDIPNATYCVLWDAFASSGVKEIKGFDKVETGNFSRAFTGCRDLNRIEDGAFSNFDKGFEIWQDTSDSVDAVGRLGVFNKTFRNCINLKSIPNGMFDKITQFVGIRMFSYCFSRSGIEYLPENFLGNIDDTNTDYSTVWQEFQAMFVSSKLKSIPNGMFGKIKYVPYWQFRWCFEDCTDLESIPETFFDNFIGYPDADPDHGQFGLAYMFDGCSKLTGDIVFRSLTKIGDRMLANMFVDTKITSLSFPALKSDSFQYGNSNSFMNMLVGVNGCTVHFPSNVQSVIGDWASVMNGFGGTNTTVLFDLPATE